MQGLSRHTRKATRKARRKRAAELNIVSMIDVLTVLVFFLLVNSTGVAILGIDLPDANSKPPEKPPMLLNIVVRPSGLSVGDSSGLIRSFPMVDSGYDYVGVAHLLRDIKEQAPGEDSIQLLVDPTVNYDTIVQLMDVARIEPTPDGRGLRSLFPQISLGLPPSEK